MRSRKNVVLGKLLILTLVGGLLLSGGEIEKVEIVFKDGVGYDSEKLIQSV